MNNDAAGSSSDYLGTMEDFRASATAFSQLTGVLGGFSMTILVLVLSLVQENKTARDWSAALLLLAATSYIYASGILANSMNVDALAQVASNSESMRNFQNRIFTRGVIAFHTGNVLLPVAIVVTLYQESLWVGVAASIIMCLVAALVVNENIVSGIRLMRSAKEQKKNGNTKLLINPISPASEHRDFPSESGLGWPDGFH